MTYADVQSASPQLPLAGLRVLDMSHVGAGPFCSSILGQLGADVVKLEGLDGDRMRQNEPRIGAGSLGYYFASVNLQKRFMQIDLKSEHGRTALHRIIPSIDVVVENFRPGVADRLSAGPEQLRSLNPKLIYCSIKGFRGGSKYADLGSIDYVHEAMTGVMSMTRHPGKTPPLPGYPAADFSGALYAVLAVVLAVRMRDSSGLGQFVEVPLQDSLLSLLPLRLGYTLATGEKFPALGGQHRDFAPFGVFPTADHPIVIAVATDRLWRRFTDVFPSLDLPDFTNAAERLAGREKLYAMLEPILLARTSSHWVEGLGSVGVPAGVVMDTDEVCRDDYVQDMLVRLQVAGQDYQWVPYAPIHSAFAPVATKPPDVPGAHTRETLSDFGFSQAEIDDLFAVGAVDGH